MSVRGYSNKFYTWKEGPVTVTRDLHDTDYEELGGNLAGHYAHLGSKRTDLRKSREYQKRSRVDFRSDMISVNKYHGNKPRKLTKRVTFADTNRPRQQESFSLKRTVYLLYRRYYLVLFVVFLCFWGGLHIHIGFNVQNVPGVTATTTEITTTTSYYKLRPQKVSPHTFRYVINPRRLCGKNRDPFLLITVATLHQNKEYRDNIRQTWGSVIHTRRWPRENQRIDDRIKLVFLFGKHENESLNEELIRESKQYGDILQEDFMESYWNLTRKVLMGFRWMSKYCERASFIMKVDEDTFINVPFLIKHLKSRDWNNSIYGYKAVNIVVERKMKKFRVQEHAFPHKTYPPYSTGNMYVMPSDLAKAIFYISEYIPYVNIEDAHITGILGNILSVKHVHVPNDLYEYDKPPDECDFALDKKLYGQKVFTHLSQAIWNNIRNSTFCQTITVQQKLKEVKTEVPIPFPKGHPMRNFMLAIPKNNG